VRSATVANVMPFRDVAPDQRVRHNI
jgi:hypothetical protein